MTPDRRTLAEASQTIDRLLEVYQLPPNALLAPADDGQRAAVETLTPVLTEVLATHEVDLDAVLGYLAAPTGDTVADLVDLADQLLTGETRDTYMSKLRFFCDGWRILPEQLDDAVAAAKQAGLRTDLSSDPDDYPQIDQPVAGGKTPRRHLVLWTAYGQVPIERVRRAKIELAGKYKRADTLTRAAARDRKRAEKGEPPLGWTGKGAVAGLYEALAYLYGLARGEGIIDVTVDPLADIKAPDRGETNRRPQSREEIESLWRTVVLHASDPNLDRLLIKFFFHTGARRAGAINLTLGMLNFERQSVTLMQKYGKATEVPVCRSLLDELAAFAASRGSTHPDDPAFRVDVLDRATGELRPLTDRHFDTLHDRVRGNLQWARKEGWTVHYATTPRPRCTTSAGRPSPAGS